ncbi:hypothetical protein K1T71_005673 [Dendrolimus kikuchii]|uniref:Uncharacterized protein n=1 Tax=Dendrolimus kikuchii TaxID=765133 RepID=A0ACC1D4P8_9NEOP|nr:hypothetical protein K1T71_005673 [Dendrolimus kikuchii]
MFFVFYISVLIIQSLVINSYKIQRTSAAYLNGYSNKKEHNLKRTDTTPKIFTTRKPMFKTIQNFSKAISGDLKSNVFDKMLSDEMYSIKKHFHDRDTANGATIKLSTEIDAPTPTLQILQKWSVVELLNTLHEIDNVKQNFRELNENCSAKEVVDKEVNKEELVEKNISNDKVIELRSLSHHLPSHELNNYDQSSECSCLESNTCTTCTHRTTDRNVKFCSHTEKSTQMSFIYPTMYLSYQPVYLNPVTEMPYKLTYYQPNVVNDLKFTRKKKHRKTTSRDSEEDLYYDSNDSKGKHRLNKHYSEHRDVIEYKDKEINGDFIINVDYDLESNKKVVSENDIKIHERPYDINKQRLVNNIVGDLNKFYRDSVIKKCYCSSSSILTNLKFHLYFAIVYIPNVSI